MNLVIQPIHPINAVNSGNPETASREERQQELQVHQVVRATVAEGGQERVTLEFGGKRFEAETQVLLRTGQKLELGVVATSPRLELRLIPDPVHERLGQLLPLLWKGWGARLVGDLAGGAFPQLSAAARLTLERWSALAGRIEETADGAALRELAERLGLRLEARLAAGDGGEGGGTLKGALLEAARLLHDSDPLLAERARQLVQTVELFQLIQLRLQPQGTSMVPLLLPFAEQAFLLVRDRGAGAEEGDAPLLISFHLTLQALGDMRIDLLQDEGGLHLRLLCQGGAEAGFVAGFRGELESALAPFRLQGVSFAAGAESPARELLRKLFPDGNGLLDKRV